MSNEINFLNSLKKQGLVLDTNPDGTINSVVTVDSNTIIDVDYFIDSIEVEVTRKYQFYCDDKVRFVLDLDNTALTTDDGINCETDTDFTNNNELFEFFADRLADFYRDEIEFIPNDFNDLTKMLNRKIDNIGLNNGACAYIKPEGSAPAVLSDPESYKCVLSLSTWAGPTAHNSDNTQYLKAKEREFFDYYNLLIDNIQFNN